MIFTKIVNLGVVDNMQTGSDTPSNNPDTGAIGSFWDWLKSVFSDIWDWLKSLFDDFTSFFWIIIAMLALVLLFTIGLPLVKLIIKLLWLLLKGIWFVITLPFKLIAKLIEKIKDNKSG